MGNLYEAEYPNPVTEEDSKESKSYKSMNSEELDSFVGILPSKARPKAAAKQIIVENVSKSSKSKV